MLWKETLRQACKRPSRTTGKASRGLEVRTTSAAACLHGRRNPTASTQPEKRKASLSLTCPRKAVPPKLGLWLEKAASAETGCLQ